MQNYYWVYVTCKNKDEALKIGEQIVKDRLCACVNIMGPSTSIYHWDGELVIDQECTMVIKTCKTLYSDLENKIKSLHSYKNPCILALSIEKGSKPYLDWITESTLNK